MRPTRELFGQLCTAYFVSTQTAGRQPFFRHERWEILLRDTILRYADQEYALHAFVIMPDHVHLLIVPERTIEKAVQMIKGGFSFQASRQFNWGFEIWQPGVSDHRIRNEADWQTHLAYIRRNPIEAGLPEGSRPYPYIEFPKPDFPQGLKPAGLNGEEDVRAEAGTLHAEAGTLHAEARTLQGGAQHSASSEVD